MGEKLKPDDGRAQVVLPDSLFHLESRLSHKSYLLSIRKRQLLESLVVLFPLRFYSEYRVYLQDRGQNENYI